MNSSNAAPRSIEILLVEDRPTDAELTQEALAEAKVHNTLHVVTDGVDAMRFLRRQDSFARAPRPDLVLLDLNLPRKDGREVLAEVKADPSLKYIPVVVRTTSRDERDILGAYGLHANCSITKPVDFEQFATVVCHLDEFWFRVVRLPPGA